MEIGEAKRLYQEALLAITEKELDRLRDEDANRKREEKIRFRWAKHSRIAMRFDIDLHKRGLEAFKALDEVEPCPEYKAYILCWQEKVAQDVERLKGFEAVYGEEYPE